MLSNVIYGCSGWLLWCERTRPSTVHTALRPFVLARHKHFQWSEKETGAWGIPYNVYILYIIYCVYSNECVFGDMVSDQNRLKYIQQMQVMHKSNFPRSQRLYEFTNTILMAKSGSSFWIRFKRKKVQIQLDRFSEEIIKSCLSGVWQAGEMNWLDGIGHRTLAGKFINSAAFILPLILIYSKFQCIWLALLDKMI